MVKPIAARMTKRTTPMKLTIREFLATTFSSSPLPAKIQNVMKPKMGTKKLKMYTNHLARPIMHLLKCVYISFSIIAKAISYQVSLIILPSVYLSIPRVTLFSIINISLSKQVNRLCQAR